MREGTGNFQNGDLLYMATHPVADAIRIGRTKPYECSYPVMVERPRIKERRNRITRETDSRTDNLYTIHGFALPAVSIMRLIMIDMIIARIAGSALIGGMKYE